MTELLSKAFEEASKLSPAFQDELAHQILETLASESRWAETLAHTQDPLEELADQALPELRAGR